MLEKQKEPQLLLPFLFALKEKKRHLAAEHPAVSTIDLGVSPSLQHYRPTCAETGAPSKSRGALEHWRNVIYI